MRDFPINTSIPVTLYSNMLAFRDSIISFKVDGDLLETMTNKISMSAFLIQKIKNYFMSLEKERFLILIRKDKKVKEINLL